MPIIVTPELLQKLAQLGVTTLHKPGFSLPDHTLLEAPCSLKWMDIHHSLELGAFSYAVSGFFFACRIGRYCSFGEQVQIGRHPHPMHWVSTSPLFYQSMPAVLDQPLPKGETLVPHKDFPRLGPPVTAKLTQIGHDVWIGHGAFILPGITIGTGAVIAAMSVVTKDVPPYAVVAGSPAQVKRFRFPKPRIAALLASRWWEFAPWDLKGAPVEQFPNFFQFIKNLREGGAKPYAPTIVDLRTLKGD